MSIPRGDELDGDGFVVDLVGALGHIDGTQAATTEFAEKLIGADETGRGFRVQIDDRALDAAGEVGVAGEQADHLLGKERFAIGVGFVEALSVIFFRSHASVKRCPRPTLATEILSA